MFQTIISNLEELKTLIRSPMTDITLLITGLLSLAIIFLLIRILIRLNKPAQTDAMKENLAIFGDNLDRINNSLKDEFQRNREESSKVAKDNRDELLKSLESFDNRLSGNIKDFNENQRLNFESSISKSKEQAQNIESRLEKMRATIENKLKEIQTDNSAKLEKMRETVNEKLQETLNTRISESFKLVTDQLEQVYKGLGDMQKLAVGVGDLKKVLSNVKTRGIMGEIQLGSILEQYLSPEQFLKNVVVKPGSKESVEYAIKLPGNENPDEPVLLAIDSKFPIEDYQRLMEIYENIADNTKEEIIKAEKAFDNSVLKSAKTINQKYISPPVTTNFAIMFVPTEGLYAQILTRTGLFEQVQRDSNITVVGPSNLVAFLSSLQMGFRTLAVQKRSSEVWQILGAVKTEFESFEKVLEKAQNQLISASGNIEKLVGTRSRAIKRKLRNIQELPVSDAAKLLESKDPELKDPEEENDDMDDGRED
jgi:DNA recombination protein RmuC